MKSILLAALVGMAAVSGFWYGKTRAKTETLYVARPVEVLREPTFDELYASGYMRQDRCNDLKEETHLDGFDEGYEMGKARGWEYGYAQARADWR